MKWDSAEHASEKENDNTEKTTKSKPGLELGTRDSLAADLPHELKKGQEKMEGWGVEDSQGARSACRGGGERVELFL